MKEVYYTYNNEALACCVVLAVLRQLKSIPLARACLILPFLFDDRTVKLLNEKGKAEITLKEAVEYRPQLFASFNNRFLSLLPVTINTLIMLKKSQKISFSDAITLNGDYSVDDVDMGIRYQSIEQAIPYFLKLTASHTTQELYKILNVQL